MLLNISLTLFIIFVLSNLIHRTYMQPTMFALYGLTSLFLAFLVESPLFQTYFVQTLIASSGSVASVVVPFVLLALVYLIYQRVLKKEQVKHIHKLLSGLMIGIILIFIALTFWEVSRQSDAAQTLTSVYALLALYFFILLTIYILMNLFIDVWSRSKDATTIIVLGSQLEDIGEITNLLKRRLDKSIQLYHRQEAKLEKAITIIVTGGSQSNGRFTEADKMAEYLIKQGIPRKQIIKERKARNTLENFQASKYIIEAKSLAKPPLVITSRFHLVRSEYIARHAQLVAYFEGSNTPAYSWYFSILREFFAYLLLTKEMNFFFIMILIVQGIIHYFA